MAKVYRYYSILRPIGPGTFPKEGLIAFQNFNSRIPAREIDHMAWGFLAYDRKLTDKEVDNYDFVFAGEVEEDEEEL